MEEEKLTVDDLVKLTGRSRVTIYKRAKEFGRLPTVDEVLTHRGAGRPRKY